MAADDLTTSLARAAELVGHGPSAAYRRRGPRELLRRAVLRLLKPYSHYQRELDREIVSSLSRQYELFGHLVKRHSEQIERLEDLGRELILTAESLRRAIADAAEESSAAAGQAMLTLASAQRAMADAEQIASELNAEPYISGAPFRRISSAVGAAIGFDSESPIDRTDAYAVFEDFFRGPAERVVESQRPYVSLVSEHEPVLDIGCGRGEFLALLAREGIAASGVDADVGMVERCRKAGLDVVNDDINHHLASIQDGSLGAIFSAQVIEHLPYRDLGRLLELALQKLRPGGVFIAETVNPHRIASLKTFWVDPTHQHPIFPEAALALVRIAGFQSAYVFAPGFDDYEQARRQSPSYAIVATAAPQPDVAASGADSDVATAGQHPDVAASGPESDVAPSRPDSDVATAPQPERRT